MMTKPHNRFIAILAALVLVLSIAACENQNPADGPGTSPTSEPTEPTGGGPDDPSNATEGAGTTTSDPSTEPSATEPLDSTDPTGGGPDNLDQPAEGVEQIDETETFETNEPAGGGPTDQMNQDEFESDTDAGSLQGTPADPNLP